MRAPTLLLVSRGCWRRVGTRAEVAGNLQLWHSGQSGTGRRLGLSRGRPCLRSGRLRDERDKKNSPLQLLQVYAVLSCT